MMEADKMIETIKAVKPGDKLELVFTDKSYSDELKRSVDAIVDMDDNTIKFEGMTVLYLMLVAENGFQYGSETYTITILDEFDPDHFIAQTIEHEMLESVKLA